jgi:hypothetical protein
MKDEVEYAHFEVWSVASNRGLMPILTPAFPCQNATDPVTNSTKSVILKECRRGLEIMSLWKSDVDDEEILGNLFQALDPVSWGDAIVIRVSGKTKKIYSRIKGFVELKIRSLVNILERNFEGEIRPFPGFDDLEEEGVIGGIMRVGIRFSSSVPDCRMAIDKWMKQLAEWNERDEYIGQFEVEVSWTAGRDKRGLEPSIDDVESKKLKL